MSLNSIREFVSILEENGELIRISKRVHWKYEIGDLTRKESTDNNTRALLFENIVDYSGFSVLTNALSTFSKYTLLLGLESNTPSEMIVDEIARRLKSPIEPEVIESKPEHMDAQEESVDLTRLPVPFWSEMDAGRYIGTWHINITKDPENGQTNVGIYRMQMVDEKTTYVSFSPRSDINSHFEKAEKMDQPLAMAVAIGVDERIALAAATSMQSGVDEYHHAGGLMKRPLKLVKAIEVDLDVPRESEIILEGYLRPHMRALEGPFFDYAGIPKGNSHAAIFDISRMYFRRKPIFRGASIGVSGGEDHILYSLLAKCGCLDFHGSRLRQNIQNMLLRNSLYKIFQLSGRLGGVFK